MSLQIAAQGPAPKAPSKINNKKPQSGANKIYDLVCVGFGTAALGLAVALQDSADEGRKTATVLFLESKSQFQQEQHASTTEHMEICFAQDLATTRNPMSKFTFLNYLHSQEKLKTFMGLFAESPYPVRADFEEYLAWCAGQIGNVVQYGQEVIAVAPVESNGFPVNLWTVTAVNGDGESRVVAARNVIIATGGEAQIVQHPSRGDTAGQDHPLEMLQVAEAIQELSKPVMKKTDVERFATVVTKSDDILNEVFYEEPFEMMRAML